MLDVHTIQRKDMLTIYIWVYCLFVTCGTVFFEAAVFNSILCVAVDNFTSSRSCQPGCGDGKGNGAVIARLVSKWYSIIKMYVRQRFMPKTAFDIVEDVSNRQIFAHQCYRHSNFIWNSGWHSRKCTEFK
ncbi:hypothetical protein CEXT_690851 [Caerostris extrusa]|uniref:Uncharacterized protein n=1 Tax=Caerostris extrusa TaxID=172846 RepID=A0AAV4Y6Z5_CAEEX|nr:hypothetical protein CEXT_690851 [Caerostris extrusa]